MLSRKRCEGGGLQGGFVGRLVLLCLGAMKRNTLQVAVFYVTDSKDRAYLSLTLFANPFYPSSHSLVLNSLLYRFNRNWSQVSVAGGGSA